MPGPLLDTYYATKNYVLRLSQGVKEELRRKKSNVQISVLCPGPVKTNFDNVADVNFSLKGLDSDYVAKYAIDKMLAGKFIIIPGLQIKMLRCCFVQNFINFEPTSDLIEARGARRNLLCTSRRKSTRTSENGESRYTGNRPICI